MRKYSREHTCMSFTFPKTIPNGTSFFAGRNSPCGGWSFVCQKRNYKYNNENNNNNNSCTQKSNLNLTLCGKTHHCSVCCIEQPCFKCSGWLSWTCGQILLYIMSPDAQVFRGTLLYTSSTFSIAILNGTCFFSLSWDRLCFGWWFAIKLRDSTSSLWGFLAYLKKKLINNCYGIGNNVWKFQVSLMKIMPLAHIWSLCVIGGIMNTLCFRKGDNIW